MNEEHDPFIERLGEELERAAAARIRERERRHGLPRRRFLRFAALGFAAVLILSGIASAAVELGVLELRRGVHAQRVQSVPRWDTISGVSVGKEGQYVYHVVGGSAFGIACGQSDLFPTNNIYIRASHQLSASELNSLLASELTQLHVSAPKLREQIETKLKARRHAERDEPLSTKTPTPLPPGVLSVSNGCPPGQRANTRPFLSFPSANDFGFGQRSTP